MGGFPSRNVASVGHDVGAYTTVMYFTCEADAREGERTEVPAELQANTEEMNKLSIGQPEYSARSNAARMYQTVGPSRLSIERY